MHNPVKQSNDLQQACVDRMRLLPTEIPPPYNWREFQRRAQQRLPSARTRLDWRHITAAAALLVVVIGIAVWARVGTGERHVAGSGVSADSAADLTSGVRHRAGDVDALRERQVVASDLRAPRAAADAQAGEAALAAIRSQAIESWLATLPREPVVVRVGTRAAVARLEDRIAQVDDLLTSVGLDGMRADRLAALQHERVRLVGSLAQVRYAEVVASELP